MQVFRVYQSLVSVLACFFFCFLFFVLFCLFEKRLADRIVFITCIPVDVNRILPCGHVSLEWLPMPIN